MKSFEQKKIVAWFWVLGSQKYKKNKFQTLKSKYYVRNKLPFAICTA